jgi:hypothetical protein
MINSVLFSLACIIGAGFALFGILIVAPFVFLLLFSAPFALMEVVAATVENQKKPPDSPAADHPQPTHL